MTSRSESYDECRGNDGPIELKPEFRFYHDQVMFLATLRDLHGLAMQLQLLGAQQNNDQVLDLAKRLSIRTSYLVRNCASGSDWLRLKQIVGSLEPAPRSPQNER